MPHHPSGTPSSFGPLSPPLKNTTSVPCHETGVPRPSLALVPKVGVPRLDAQVACQSGIIELACHAFDTKWHALVRLLELACHAFDTKWHAQPFYWPSCLLACHAWLLKWHAQTSLAFNPFSGLLYQRATPCSSSSTPIQLWVS
ncbi:hypothetical protein AHAS_Ahas04G0100900 [Arachis hypogaea]